MTTRLRLLTAVLTMSATASLSAAADDGPTRVPVLLELFTSEGCSSCPPADQILAILDEQQPVAGAELIVLSEHVDYWNRLGWKDPYSSSLYTARQRDYTDKYHLDGVYTPQLVVDGHIGLVGNQGRAVAAAIEKARRVRKLPMAISNVAHEGNQVTAHIELQAGQGFKGRALLYVAIADNRGESQVARGENAGRSLAHVAVTRVLKQVGAIDLASGSARDVRLPAPPAAGGSRIVTFVQDSRSGQVLGVAAQKL